MKNLSKLFALSIVMLGFSLSSSAQVTATAATSATIITPISIDWATDMNFGNIAVQASTGGTVTLDAEAGALGRSTGGDGGVTLPAFDNGTVSAASFVVTGQAGYTYEITLPGSVVITNGTPAEDMTVNAFTSTPNATGTLTAGTETLYVGATLTVAAAQPAGVYTNLTDLAVTVNYN